MTSCNQVFAKQPCFLTLSLRWHAPAPLRYQPGITDIADKWKVRRATVDDIPQLISLWQLEQLDPGLLEKRFTEFQVVTDEDGRLLAAIGLQIVGTQGLLHSESIARAEYSDVLRGLLWKRLQVIIQNHALERLWTQMDTPSWRDRGFGSASEDLCKGIPTAFVGAARAWQVMILRAADANAAVERELAQFRAAQQEEVARLRVRAQTMKRVALGITVLVFLVVVAWAVVLLKYGPRMFGRQ